MALATGAAPMDVNLPSFPKNIMLEIVSKSVEGTCLHDRLPLAMCPWTEDSLAAALQNGSADTFFLYEEGGASQQSARIVASIALVLKDHVLRRFCCRADVVAALEEFKCTMLVCGSFAVNEDGSMVTWTLSHSKACRVAGTEQSGYDGLTRVQADNLAARAAPSTLTNATGVTAGTEATRSKSATMTFGKLETAVSGLLDPAVTQSQRIQYCKAIDAECR
ncbi:hypothetical protein Agub_g3659, partial [Astrephomene gubernaculifera]